MSLESLLTKIRVTPDCRLLAPAGLPLLGKSHSLPDDVREFYQLCGGVHMAEDTQYPIAIIPPTSCIPANPVLLGEVAELAQQAQGDDISWTWYIIADCGNGDYVTIDFDQERLGRCYDSFHETYGLVGETPIIAFSFTELLTRFYESRGQRWYWLRPDFIPLGDAYDKAV